MFLLFWNYMTNTSLHGWFIREHFSNMATLKSQGKSNFKTNKNMLFLNVTTHYIKKKLVSFTLYILEKNSVFLVVTWHGYECLALRKSFLWKGQIIGSNVPECFSILHWIFALYSCICECFKVLCCLAL